MVGWWPSAGARLPLRAVRLGARARRRRADESGFAVELTRCSRFANAG